MSTSDKICTDSCKDSDDVCDVNVMLQNISTTDKDEDIVSCANCGKEGNDINNICNKCKMVRYCNAACKKKHRSKHKKQCEEHIRLAAEQSAKLHDIELFKQPPPKEDCPICFLLLPTLETGSRYKTCCGKFICSGCIYAPVYDDQGNEVDNEKKCPFCRTPHPTTVEEGIEREKKRFEAGDAVAIFNIGCYNYYGTNGYPQDCKKALELWHRAAELGYAKTYTNIGNAYHNGNGVEADKEKSVHYHELAAMKGDVTARYNLGCMEKKAGKEMALRHLMGGNVVAWHNLDDILRATKGNMDRAVKHHMIAVGSGYSKSLEKIKEMFTDGSATKEDYTRALQLYQTYLAEVKSLQRDKAAAANEDYRYY